MSKYILDATIDKVITGFVTIYATDTDGYCRSFIRKQKKMIIWKSKWKCILACTWTRYHEQTDKYVYSVSTIPSSHTVQRKRKCTRFTLYCALLYYNWYLFTAVAAVVVFVFFFVSYSSNWTPRASRKSQIVKKFFDFKLIWGSKITKKKKKKLIRSEAKKNNRNRLIRNGWLNLRIRNKVSDDLIAIFDFIQSNRNA